MTAPRGAKRAVCTPQRILPSELIEQAGSSACPGGVSTRHQSTDGPWRRGHRCGRNGDRLGALWMRRPCSVPALTAIIHQGVLRTRTGNEGPRQRVNIRTQHVIMKRIVCGVPRPTFSLQETRVARRIGSIGLNRWGTLLWGLNGITLPPAAGAWPRAGEQNGKVKHVIAAGVGDSGPSRRP